MNAFRMPKSVAFVLAAITLILGSICTEAMAAAEIAETGQVAAALAMLSGRVYEGAKGSEPPNSLALAGVTVSLYGSNDAPAMGTLLTSTITDATGWYGLVVPDRPIYEYYNIIETDPVGYISVGATTVDGTVKTANWIQYAYPLTGKTLTGNKFWDQLQATRTPTPTRTPAPPTRTPTATRTSVPPTASPTHTLIPHTATPTPTGTYVPPTVTATPIIPTATATRPVDSWRFIGHINTLTDSPSSEPIPECDVLVALLGSQVQHELGELLAETRSAEDGSYALNYTAAGSAMAAQRYEYFHVAVTDPRYEVLEATSGSGGEVTERRWIQFIHPEPGEYPENNFVVRRIAITPTPTLVVPERTDCLNLLVNGNFEEGMGNAWGSSGMVSLGPGMDSALGAQLGGVDNAGGELWQPVFIPDGSDAVQLDFWWLAESESERPGDVLDVIVQHGGRAELIATIPVTPSDQIDFAIPINIPSPVGRWMQGILDLSAYAGQTIALTFLANTDGEIPTTFRIDNVSLRGCGFAALPSSEWTFVGAAHLGEFGDDREPARNIRISLYGSADPAEPGVLMATTQTGVDGMFTLSIASHHQEYAAHYFLAVDDPNYEAVNAIAGPGGEAGPGPRIRFTRPTPGEYGENHFYVQRKPGDIVPVQPVIVPDSVQPIPPPGSPYTSTVDLYIKGIEVTQAIQCFDKSQGYTLCPDNSLELTSGKATAIRVYVGCTGCVGSSLPVSVKVHTWGGPKCIPPLCGKSWWGVVGSDEVAFNAPLGKSLAQLRASTSGSSNWIVTKTGQQLTIQVLLNWGITYKAQKVPETNFANNWAWIELPMYNRAPLNVKWALVEYRPSAYGGYQYTGTAWASTTVAGGNTGLLHKMYPMAVNYSQSASTIKYTGKDARTSQGSYDLALQIYYAWSAMQPKPNALVGWIPQDALSGITYQGCGGYAFTSPTWPAAWIAACPNPSLLQMILPHEIAHTRGLLDVNPSVSTPDPCWPSGSDTTIRETGFDTAQKAIVASGTHDIMDYSYDMWVSPYSWNRLLGKAHSKTWSKCGASGSGASAPDVASAALPAQSGGTTAQPHPELRPAILIGGAVHANGTAEFGTFYLFPSPGPFPEPDPHGEYCLEFQTVSASTVGVHCFALPSGEDHGGGPGPETRPFSLLLPAPPEMQRVVLRRGLTVLAERMASAHPPEVAVLTPTAGAVVSGMVGISWTGNDADGDTLRYAVLYSPDGGTSWSPLAFDLEQTSLEADTALWAGGANAKVRVLASDGFHTAIADSAPFEVPRKAPEVWIHTPKSDAYLQPYGAIVLTGHASDLEDGELTGEQLTWRSDRQGIIGRGAEWILPGMSLGPGKHVITLTAVDSDGMEGSAQVTVFIGYQLHLPVLLKALPPPPTSFTDNFEDGTLTG